MSDSTRLQAPHSASGSRIISTLPVDVICESVLPGLSVRDLQALDTAFTNKLHRPLVRNIWKSYQWKQLDAFLNSYDVAALCGLGVRVVEAKANHCITQNVVVLNSVLKLEVWNYIDSELLDLIQLCPFLELLRLPSGEYSDVGVIALAQQCRRLHTIALSSSNVTYASIRALCDNCPHLQHIDTSNCYRLTDASLRAIASTYAHLLSINMINCKVTDEALIFLADKCHELQSVSLGGKYNLITNNFYTTRGIAALSAANPNIVDMCLHNCNIILDVDILHLLQCCPLLHSLTLIRCTKITDAAVIAVAISCPQLRSLTINGCCCGNTISDAALIAIGQHCHDLKILIILIVDLITDVGVSAVAAGCPLLQELYLTEITICEAGMNALASCCKNLQKVSLVRCFWDTCNGITSLVTNCPLLSELTLLCCDDIDNACLHAISRHCRNLTRLKIRAHSVSDAAPFVAVATSCPNLRQLLIPSTLVEVVKDQLPRFLHNTVFAI